MKLINLSKNNELISDSVIIADNFYTRAVGLLGKKSLDNSMALWIKKCKTIHTFFMRFSLDLIFVDKNLIVTKLYYNVKPWRVTAFKFKSDSVFELNAGQLLQKNIKVEDQLNVVP